MRCLSFYAAHFCFSFHAVHIAGVDKVAANALSRGDLSTFFSYFPQASPTPTAVLPAIGHLSSGGGCSVLLFTWHSWLYSKSLQVSSVKVHQLLCSVSRATSSAILCSFVSFLANQNLKFQSIKCYMYLSGVRHMQISNGFCDPFANSPFVKLDYVLKGINRSQACCGCSSHQRLPITPKILCAIKALWKVN